MRIEILCLLHFCRPGFRTLHISPWSSKDLQVLRICRSKRLDMGLKRVSWVQRYQGQCRALRPLGHQGYRLRNHKKDQPLCSGYTERIRKKKGAPGWSIRGGKKHGTSPRTGPSGGEPGAADWSVQGSRENMTEHPTRRARKQRG